MIWLKFLPTRLLPLDKSHLSSLGINPIRYMKTFMIINLHAKQKYFSVHHFFPRTVVNMMYRVGSRLWCSRCQFLPREVTLLILWVVWIVVYGFGFGSWLNCWVHYLIISSHTNIIKNYHIATSSKQPYQDVP